MAYAIADRVFERTTFVGGTGAVSLEVSAVTDHQTFLSGWGASGSGYYCLVRAGTGQWETGLGTLNAGGTTLTRTTVLHGSSGTGVPVSFSAGILDCFGTLPASQIVDKSHQNVIKLLVGGPPSVPADGDIWLESNTNTGLKIRINGVTKTVTLS